MTSLSVLLFGSIASKYQDSFTFLRPILVKADMKMPLNVYVSFIFFSAFMIFIVSLSVTIFLSLFVFTSIFAKILAPVLAPIVVPAFCFLVFMLYPFSRASTRKKNIETNLPFVLTHMGSIAESGIPPYYIFRLIGNFDEYGDIAKEFRKIQRNMEVYGIDPLTAIRAVSERSPSEMFKQVLMGFVTTTESGGNIKTFLKSAGDQALFEWRTRREKFLRQLEAYSEMYTGLMVAAPLFLISLFIVMGMISPTLGGFSILDLTKFSVYLLVPIMNIAFLLFLRGVEVEI